MQLTLGLFLTRSRLSGILPPSFPMVYGQVCVVWVKRRGGEFHLELIALSAYVVPEVTPQIKTNSTMYMDNEIQSNVCYEPFGSFIWNVPREMNYQHGYR